MHSTGPLLVSCGVRVCASMCVWCLYAWLGHSTLAAFVEPVSERGCGL